MEDTAKYKDAKVEWKWVILFYAVAFCLSAPVNSGYMSEAYQNLTRGTIFYNAEFVLAGFGTLVAALLAFRFHNDFPRSITTFWGRAKLKNFTIAIVPLFVYTILGIPNELGLNEHLYALLISVVLTIYALSEEVFWRGYLINALGPLDNWKNYYILGFLWWAWHFPFFREDGCTMFLAIVIASSFLIGRFVEGTKSYLSAAGLHAMVVIMQIGNNTEPMLWAGGVIIVIWVVLGRFWKEGR